MAQVSSGSFNTTSAEGRYLTFNWSVESTNIAENYKIIYWSLVGAGADGFVTCGNFKVTISGNTVYNSATRINVYKGTVIASGRYKMQMSNEGTKTFKATAEAGIYEVAVNCRGEGTWELPTINRYAKITNFVVEKIDETSVKYNWSADVTCDYAWYSKDNGNTWTGLPNSNIVSGLSANTSYSFKLRVRRKDSQLTTDSSTYYQTTYDYPYCNSTPSFTIGDKVNIGLYNPLGRNCTVQMIGADGSTIYNGDGWTGTGIGDFATATIVQNLYNSIPNSKNGTYRIVVSYGSSSKGITGGTYKIRGNEVPTINGFDYIDVNASTVALTGNNTHIIQNKSVVNARFHDATPNKGAGSIVKYILEVNGLKVEGTKVGQYDLGTINSANDVGLKLTATDSRGLSASKTITVKMLAHSNPSALVSLERKNNYEDETYLKVDGAVSSINGKNVMTIKYRYKVSGGSYGSFTNISDNTQVTLNLNKNNAYIFNIVVTDSLGATYNKEYSIGKGVFPLFIDTKLNSVGVNCLPINENSLEVNGNIHSGDIKCKNLLCLPYTADNKLTDTSTRDDYTVGTGYYCYLEAGKQYTFSCKTDATWGGSTSTDTVEVFLLKDNAYDLYISINANPKTFTVTASGYYFVRYDINKSGVTHSFWDFQIEEGNVATDFVEGKILNNKQIYSLGEIKIGTWINGKPLYRKVIIIPASSFGTGTASSGTSISIPHNIKNIGVVVREDLIWERPTTVKQKRILPSTFYGDAGWDGQMLVDTTNIQCELGASVLSAIRIASYIYAIIEYTKV